MYCLIILNIYLYANIFIITILIKYCLTILADPTNSSRISLKNNKFSNIFNTKDYRKT